MESPTPRASDLKTRLIYVFASLLFASRIHLNHPIGNVNLDAWELLGSASGPGICHPPGYAVYNLCGYFFISLGELFGFEPISSLGALSYLCALISLLGFLYLFHGKVLPQLILLFSLLSLKIFVYTASVIEVYSMHLLFFTLFLITFFKALNEKKWSLPFFLCASLLFSHHLSSLVPGLIFVAFLVFTRRVFLKHGVLLVLFPGLQAFYLLTFSSHQTNTWFSLAQFDHLYVFLTGKMYAQAFFSVPDLKGLEFIFGTLFQGIPSPLFPALVFALLYLFYRRLSGDFLVLGFLGMSILIQSFYRVPDLQVFFLVPFCLLIFFISKVACEMPLFAKVSLVLALLSYASTFQLKIPKHAYENYYKAASRDVSRLILKRASPLFLAYDHSFFLQRLNDSKENEIPIKIMTARCFSAPVFWDHCKARYAELSSFQASEEFQRLSKFELASPELHFDTLTRFLAFGIQQGDICFPDSKKRFQKAAQSAGLSVQKEGKFACISREKHLQ